MVAFKNRSVVSYSLFFYAIIVRVLKYLVHRHWISKCQHFTTKYDGVKMVLKSSHCVKTVMLLCQDGLNILTQAYIIVEF